MKSVYIETSIPSYLTARPSRDVRATAWQQVTIEWWEQERDKYQLFVSELVLAEAAAGDSAAAKRRLDSMAGISELAISDEVKDFAALLVADGGILEHAKADALHVAVASVHGTDYLLTWNCRHIDNPGTKPLVRAICVSAGYACPEICTPLELLSEDVENV